MIDVGSAVGYLLLDLSGWNKGLQSAKTALKTFTDDSATAMDKASALSSALKGVGTGLTTTVTTPLVGLGTAAVKTAANFEQAMAQVAAVSGLDTAGAEFEALGEKAKEMGAKTKFSASEAAEAFNYMAMAGWDAQQMMDGIEGVMNLAAASGEDLASVSDIVTDALTGFGLAASDSAHFADVLAAASNSANTNVSMLGESFKYVAPVAGSLGFSVEDVSVALGLMANSGIKASQAGTSLRTLFTNLVHPVGQSAEAIEALGITITNSDGSMKSLDTIMKELRSTFSNMTESQKASYAAMLAGQEGMSGLLAIVNATDEDFNKLTESISNAGGTAQDMAETQLDTLDGKITLLKSALEGLAISFGEVLLPMLTSMVEKITAVINWFNNLSDGTKKLIVTIGGIAAVVGPLLILIGNIISIVIKVINAIKLIQTAITAVKGAMVALNAVLLANPIVLVVAAIAALVAGFVVLWNKCEAFREFWINLWDAIKEAFAGVAESIGELISNIADWFSTLPEKIGKTVDAVVNWFTQLPSRISTAISGAIDVVSSWAQGVYTSLTTNISMAIETVAGWFNQLPSKIGYALGYALGTVVTWVRDVYTTLTTVVPQIIESVVNWFTSLPGKIAEGLNRAYTTISEWCINVLTAFGEWFTELLTTFYDWFTQLPERISEWLSQALQVVIDWGVNLVKSIGDALKEFIGSVVEWLSQLPDKFKEWFDSVIEFLKGLPAQMYEIGANILQSLWDGLVSIWNNLLDWINGIVDQIKKAFGSAKEGYSDATSKGRKVSGSYATGLDYVPRTMNVQVHEGERILTKQENKDYNSGNYGNGYPETINFELSIPLDGEVVARKQYSYNLREGVLRGDDLIEGGATS
nr:MAG TPA: minor tail protein [Caudoviricetes sp.]